MVSRKSRTQCSVGGKAPWQDKNVVAARFRFFRIIRHLGEDRWQKLMAITNYLDQRETAKEEVLDLLGNSTEENHGDLSILSIEDMKDAIHSVKCEKEKQQTSSTPAKTPGHYNRANMPTQPVSNPHQSRTRLQARVEHCRRKGSARGEKQEWAGRLRQRRRFKVQLREEEVLIEV